MHARQPKPSLSIFTQHESVPNLYGGWYHAEQGAPADGPLTTLASRP